MVSVIIYADGDNTTIEYSIGGAKLYRFIGRWGGTGTFIVSGSDFQLIRNLSISQKTKIEYKFRYDNGYLKNERLYIRAKLVDLKLDDPRKKISGLKNIGRLKLEQRLLHYMTYATNKDIHYRYLHFRKSYVMFGTNSFVYIGPKSIGYSKKYFKVDMDVMDLLRWGVYDIYDNGNEIYMISQSLGTGGAAAIIPKPTKDDGFKAFKMPPKESMTYIELDKRFKDIRTAIHRTWDPYLYVYITKDLIVFKNYQKVYTCPITQRSSNIYNVKFRVLSPYIDIFSPGYFYIDLKKDPGILIKKDTFTNEIFGITIKEVTREYNKGTK